MERKYCSYGDIARSDPVRPGRWGTSVVGLAVQRPDGKYFGSISAPEPVYDHVLEFLKRNHGRKLREVMDSEIDTADVIE